MTILWWTTKRRIKSWKSYRTHSNIIISNQNTQHSNVTGNRNATKQCSQQINKTVVIITRLLTLPAWYTVQCLCNGQVSARPSVPLTDIHRMPQPGRGWTADIDRLATGARVAAAGSVMLRAEVWGSTETCSATVHVQTRNDDIGTVQLQAPTNYTHQWLQHSMLNAAVERHRNSLPTAEVHARFPSCQCSSV